MQDFLPNLTAKKWGAHYTWNISDNYVKKKNTLAFTKS